MKPRTLKLGALVALVAFVLTVAVSSRIGGPAGLQGGRLAPCPDSPNCVNSEAEDGPAAVAPFELDGEPRAAFRALVELLRSEPRATVVEVTDQYAHVVFVTRFMRFRDDLELRLDPEAGVVHVRSASRLGHSDLGVNRARVERIRRRWAATDR